MVALTLRLPTIALTLALSASSGAGQTRGQHPAASSGAGASLRVALPGTGNPRPSIDRFGPSTLIEAGKLRLLVDAGRGVSMRLFQIGGNALLAGIDAVLFTHLHSDHVVGLPDLWLTGWIFGRQNRIESGTGYGVPDFSSTKGHSRTALALDSLRAFVPVVAVLLVIVLRTHLEDRTLQGELDGYARYATRVRYRLVPGIW